MELNHLREIAHQGMALSASPFLRHQKEGRYRFQEGVAFIRQDLPGPGFNFAAALRFTPPLERILEICQDFFVGCAGGYGILVEADAGHPIEEQIRNRGWQVAEDEPALVLPSLPATLEVPPRLDIRRIDDEPGLHAFLETLSEGFETSRDIPETFWTSACIRDPDIVFLLGYCAGQPVATAVLGRIGQIATIHGIATVAPFRRRGFGRALTWTAARAGAELGCTVAALRAMGVSLEMYRKMGFVHVCNHRTYTVPLPS
jgi:GNAT superfamily N-acetyltransferase